jgi:hypothetical protein
MSRRLSYLSFATAYAILMLIVLFARSDGSSIFGNVFESAPASRSPTGQSTLSAKSTRGQPSAAYELR